MSGQDEEGLDNEGSWPGDSSPEGCSSPNGLHSPVMQLRLEVQTSQLGGQQAHGNGPGNSETQRQLDAERIAQLEAALAASKRAEQELAAQLARAEGRATVAEGSLRARAEQLGQGLGELQAQHAASVAAQRAQHAEELAAQRMRQEEASAAAQADWEARLQQLASSKTGLEASVNREQQRVKELQARLEKESCKQEAVPELMRHSEALQSQVERLQGAAQEERRRAGRAAQAGEAAVQQERQLAEAAALEAQQRMQEATREQDKAVRQARAKQQRAEAELRAAKQAAKVYESRLQELESLNAKKDLQLDAVVQQVSLMQHELEALRRGLSGRQAAAAEAARGEYAAALYSCQAQLEAVKAQLSEEALACSRQSQALAAILRILGAHAGEVAPLAAAEEECEDSRAGGHVNASTAAAVVPADPAKVVAFVEAVSSSMLDVQQQWELEKAEMAAALEVAEAVHVQLGQLLERERQDNRGMAAEGAEMAAALQGTTAELAAAQEQLHELDAAKAGRAAAERALEACRSELSAAVAKAGSAGDEAVKWQGAAVALEVRAGQAACEAEAARKEAKAAREELEAKDGRIAEMRSAMAAALQERSISAVGMSTALAQAQAAAAAACQPALQHLQTAMAVLGGEGEPQAADLAATLQAVAAMLRELPPADVELAACVGTLGRAVQQLAAGYSHVAAMTQERGKVHHILSSVISQLQAAAEGHPSRLHTGALSLSGGTSLSLPGSTTPVAASGLSLVELLQRLTAGVVGMVEGLAVEKESLESQMLHEQDESAHLRSQLQSMRSVLSSLQNHTALEHQDALLALEQARQRLAQLSADNAELAQRAEQAQQASDALRDASAREWCNVRDDLSGLVEQAERAQLTADAASKQQQEEYERRLAQASQQASEATAARTAAEAAATRLQQELTEARRELAAAEQQVAAREEALRSGLQASHAGMQELEARVAHLQKQLATRARTGGISAAPAKKAAAAASAAGALKRENKRLREQVEALQGQVHMLDERVRHSVQQLRQARDLAETAQHSIADAEGRASRAEALLRKVDERKAAAEVERRKATETAGRLEQEALELQSRLEAAQHRERVAQAEAERLRAGYSKRESDSRQLSGALSQLEVAEAALRDSQSTSGRLLQDCSELQRDNRRLEEEARQLGEQLQDARQEAAAATDQVQDLQASLDSVLTELHIARSLLDNQRHEEMQQLEEEAAAEAEAMAARQGSGQGPLYQQQLVAYPVRVGSLRFDPGAQPREDSQLEQAMNNVLAARDTNARSNDSLSRGRSTSRTAKPLTSTIGQEPATPAVDAGFQPSPLRQRASPETQTPGTPAVWNLGQSPAGTARMSASQQQQEGLDRQQQQHERQPEEERQEGDESRPVSGASSSSKSGAAGVDVSDVRRLVRTVESLQRQLAVKNDRIKQLRAALQQAAASGASFTPPGSRPGSAATAATGVMASGNGGGSSGEVLVLEQRLAAARQQVESMRALGAHLERQVSEAQQAQQAQREVQAQLARVASQLAAVMAAGSGSSSSADVSTSGAEAVHLSSIHGAALPATNGDAASLLRHQASQLEQLASKVGREVEGARRELTAARQHGSTLTMQLASRNALVDALQAQLRTTLSSSRGSSGDNVSSSSRPGASSTPGSADALLAPPPATLEQPFPADGGSTAGTAGTATPTDALGSLDRIVALWRQACAAKDSQLHELRGELDQAQGNLAQAQIELDSLTSATQELSERQRQGGQLIEELQQRLAEAEQRCGVASAAEQALAVRCGELEAAVEEAREAGELEGGAAREAWQGRAAAEQQAASLEQRLRAAEAQVRELQHAAQLAQLSLGDSEAMRQQTAALKADLAAAREQASAAERRAADLQQQLSQLQAAEGASSALAARLEAARQAEQQLLGRVRELEAGLSAAEQAAEQAELAAAAREADNRHLQQRLAASQQQLAEAVEAVGQQSAALEGLQAALAQQRRQQEAWDEAAVTHGQLARQLAASQQQLAQARQEAAVAQKQAEVLRAAAATVEAESARAAAERRHVEAKHASVQDSLHRFQRGVAVLSRTLQQLQEAGAGGNSQDRLLASLQAGLGSKSAAANSAAASMPVEQLVDEILLQVHRRDCEVSALVAEVAHLEAAMAGKMRQAADAEAQQQHHQRSVARLKDQLHWCSQESEALKRQLGEKEAQLRMAGAGLTPRARSSGR